MKSGLNVMTLFLLNDLLNISDEKGNHVFWTQFFDSDHCAVVCLGLRMPEVILVYFSLCLPFSFSFYQKSSMKPEDVTTVEKASPPSKKARTADFSSVVKRSHSVTENSILDIMTDSIGKFKEKVINDR